jgi:hypothetical protein
MSAQARPTLYRGIRMRSRLEADFARWLDGTDSPWSTWAWAYEPECFGDEAGQYLPDFRLTSPGFPTQYIEVKPFEYEGDIPALTKRMEIVWSSLPEAILALVFWEWQQTGPEAVVFGWPGSRERLLAENGQAFRLTPRAR